MAKNPATDFEDTPYEAHHPSDEALSRLEEENKREQRGKLERFLRVALPLLGALIITYTVVLAILFLMGWTAAPLPFAQLSDADETSVAKSDRIDLSTWSDEELAAQMCMVVVADDSATTLQSWAATGAGLSSMMR